MARLKICRCTEIDIRKANSRTIDENEVEGPLEQGLQIKYRFLPVTYTPTNKLRQLLVRCTVTSGSVATREDGRYVEMRGTRQVQLANAGKLQA